MRPTSICLVLWVIRIVATVQKREWPKHVDSIPCLWLLLYTCVHLLVSAVVSNCSVHGYTHLKHARTLPTFSAYFRSDSVMWNFFSCRCLFSVSLRMRSGVQWVQSSTKSHWKRTSSSAPFPVVPTRWTNCSHSTDFHANHQDIFPSRLISCFGTSPRPPARLILR